MHETYRFAKLKSWAATTDSCTFKVSKDEGKHKLTKEQVVYSTDMVSLANPILTSHFLRHDSPCIFGRRWHPFHDVPRTDDRRKTFASC